MQISSTKAYRFGNFYMLQKYFNDVEILIYR